MKKIVLAIVGVIIVIAVAFAIFHNADNNSSQTTNSTSNSAQSSAPAVNNAVLITKTDSKGTKYLADPSGKALYTYNNDDTNGVSNCTGACLTSWPAYVETGSTTGMPSGVGTFKRADNGQMQYTYNGQPLYFFASDSNGQVTGDGVNNFSVARPAASSTTQSGGDGQSSSPY